MFINKKIFLVILYFLCLFKFLRFVKSKLKFLIVAIKIKLGLENSPKKNKFKLKLVSIKSQHKNH